MEGNQVILSRHVVIISENVPVYAAIVINGETIQSVDLLDPSLTIEEAKQRYNEIGVVTDYENYYVSPGIIDTTVRRNWEDYTTTTKAAIAGGVTFYLEHQNLYEEIPPMNNGEIYCDYGNWAVIDNEVLDYLEQIVKQGVFALKAYLDKPSPSVACIPNLVSLFRKMKNIGLPLFLDVNIADSRKLYDLSPHRENPLDMRLSGEIPPYTEQFAGALNEDAKDSDEEEEETFSIQKAPQGRSVRYKRKKLTPGDVPMLFHSTSVELSPEIKQQSEELVTIYEDLEVRIGRNSANMDSLIQAELSQYKYNKSHKSVPVSPLPRLTPEPDNRPKSRGFRPPPLRVKKPEPKQEINQDTIYLNHLANSSDGWEAKGIEDVSAALVGIIDPDLKIHFQSLSGTRAVNAATILKNKKIANISIESASYYLYFNDRCVSNGDTRYKVYPPIRNVSNFNLIWDCLKMKSIDVISSNHNPIIPPYKQPQNGNFKLAVPGINSLGYTLAAIWTHIRRPFTSITSTYDHYIVRISKWLSYNPARVLGITESRGQIKAGCLADLVVWNPEECWLATQNHTQSPETSPFAGQEFYGKIHFVYLRGNVAYNEGDFSAHGKLIKRK